jgi:hydrocephalus-inducing protein
MPFVDDIFELSPGEGQVWSNSEIEISVTFRPDSASLFKCFAYLDISGREDRLTMNLAGKGIGPHASLSYDVLDTGDVFINEDQEYQVTIANKGDIDCKWTFLSSLSKFGSKFKFTPSEGFLGSGQSQLIDVKFTSDILGEFSEHFRFTLQGNEDMLILNIKGHVVGPTFHLDCKTIDFGVVSFDYLHSAETRLVNSSKIPMIYYLHVPQDNNPLKTEFEITPNEGTLLPGDFVDILVEFIPGQVQVYEYSLSVDVYGVGDMLLNTPLLAECIVSTVKMLSREVNYNDCFLRYPYTQDFVLTNESDTVRTKFEILPQSSHSKSVATFEAEPAIAFIEPGDSIAVKIRLIAEKLGVSKIPIQIQVAGSLEPPLQAALAFNCIGPRIVVDKNELKWGNVECLKDDKRQLVIKNDSLIPASMNFFLKVAKTSFRLPFREVVLEAQESIVMDLTSNVDDTIVHKDELHIIVTDSDNLMVPLIARGTGTTMYCKQDIQVIDFGPQLTDTGFEARITLENKGKRPQQLKWINETIRVENASRTSIIKSMKSVPSTLPKHLMPVVPIFNVSPAEITLRSRTATSFVFSGCSPFLGEISELFVLESKVFDRQYT